MQDMTVEMQMLLWSTVLCVLQFIPYLLPQIIQHGLPRMAGNREDIPEPTGMPGRAKRAHRNMIENLAPFFILVFIAHESGANSPVTALGAQLFFWSRLAFAFIYIAGIPWLRTAAFGGGLLGMAMILYEIVT